MILASEYVRVEGASDDRDMEYESTGPACMDRSKSFLNTFLITISVLNQDVLLLIHGTWDDMS